MPVGFTPKDILHKLIVRFAPASLPGAKKPYVLRLPHRTVLDQRVLAGKADAYNCPGLRDMRSRVGNRLVLSLGTDAFQLRNQYVPRVGTGTQERVADVFCN